MKQKKVGLYVPIIWTVAALLGLSLVVLQFRRARINGGWYGSEATAIIWGMYTLMASVNAVLWFIRYRRSKQQDETEE